MSEAVFKYYKYELFPTRVQKVFLDKHFGCCRWVYNHYLAKHNEQYKETGKAEGRFAQGRDLTLLKKEEDKLWLNEVGRDSLGYAIEHLDTAFKNFFRKTGKYPKFKSRHGKNSFTTHKRVQTIGNKLYIAKFREGIKFDYHREIPGQIKKCVLSRTPTNKYFVSILSSVKHTPREVTGKQIGIDLGLKHFLVTSDGSIVENPKHFDKYKRKLASAQKHLCRKIKGSNRRYRQKLKVALLHEKIGNRRLYFLHKLSSQFVKDYDIICTEDLNIKGMVKNRKLSRHISDVGWGQFLQLIDSKMGMNGQSRAKIDRFFPSSKTCFECRKIKDDLTLKDRFWVCKCGAGVDRDVNAAKNILKEGLKSIGEWDPDYRRGEKVRLPLKGAVSAKRLVPANG